jgi:hypothetical protein
VKFWDTSAIVPLCVDESPAPRSGADGFFHLVALTLQLAVHHGDAGGAGVVSGS